MKKEKSKGITLIALVITIIIMLILVVVTIGLATEGGLINKAKYGAKEQNINGEKEQIQLAYTGLRAGHVNDNIEITDSDIQSSLDSAFGENKTTVSSCEAGFDILINEKNYYYILEEDGTIIGPIDIIEIQYAGDITRNGTLDGINKPYEISCIEDLVAFSNMTNGTGKVYVNNKLENARKTNFAGKTVVLTRNLDFKSRYSYNNSETTDFGDINGIGEDGNKLITEMTTGAGFKPIGSYSGNFDGCNFKISNLYINRNAGGLFTTVDGDSGIAEIKNLNLKGNIYASSAGNIGGIVGTARYNVTIENCSFEGIIESDAENAAVGGIVGCTYGSAARTFVLEIRNCSCKGKITGKNVTGGNYGVGGILGYKFVGAAKIYNSNNQATIEGNNKVGGITGGNVAEIIECHNSGNISGKKCVGGIAGNLTANKTEKCYNTGTITGEESIGGIAGNVGGRNQNINMCYNKGKIEGTKQVAGIAGQIYAYYTSITNCYNIIDTENTNFIGIAGATASSHQSATTIISCYTICGDIGANRMKQYNCYNLSNNIPENLVSSLDTAFEMVVDDNGYNTNATIDETGLKQNAWVEDTNNINGGYPILSWQNE